MQYVSSFHHDHLVSRALSKIVSVMGRQGGGGKKKNQTLLSLIIITVIKIPDLLLWAKYFK